MIGYIDTRDLYYKNLCSLHQLISVDVKNKKRSNKK